MIGYWSILHKEFLLKVDPVKDTYLYYHSYCVHSLPFVSVTINVMISRVSFIPSHCVYVMLLGVMYSLVNYFGTLYRKTPIYSFIKWDDHISVILSVGLVIITGIVF